MIQAVAQRLRWTLRLTNLKQGRATRAAAGVALLLGSLMCADVVASPLAALATSASTKRCHNGLLVAGWRLAELRGPGGRAISCRATAKLEKSGAGEGIRTLDPNLGKVNRESLLEPVSVRYGPLTPLRSILRANLRQGILLRPLVLRPRASPVLPRPPP